METLNNAQRHAVEADDGPIAIIAGPGTGKTKTLTARIDYLLASHRAQPHEILALTFTKKAAEEMAARVNEKKVTICTFHALCNKLLGGTPHFITELERLAVIKSLPKPVDFKGLSSRELSLRISRAKNEAETDEELQKLVAAYNAALAGLGVIDFDDLLVRARDLLEHNPDKRPAYMHILVDEFQDTNALQYTLLQLLRRTDNVFVIGDPNQSIYGFRGASGNIFDTFKTDFHNCTVIELAQNYRSAASIVTLANAIFKGTTQLMAQSKTEGEVQAIEFLNEYSEAHWVVGQIEQTLGGAHMLQGSHQKARRGLSDFAILYRNRHVARHIQKYIADSGLPYQIVGDGSPYERPDIQKVMGIIRNAAGQEVHMPDFTRNQIATLLQNINTHIPPAAFARQVAELCGFKVTSELAHFIGTLVRFKNLQTAVDYFDELQKNNFYDPAAESVTLLTIHAAKGLEFEHVFLIGVEDGFLPSTKSSIEEEKRLFYVAATRAKEQLNITHATHRAGEAMRLSPFVFELSPAVLPRSQDSNLASDRRRLQKRHAKKAQTTLF